MNQKPHILMVHGIFNSGRCFNKMALHFEKQGYAVHRPTLRPNFGFASLPQLSCLVKDYIDAHIPEGARLHLIGYSMGGVILRHLLQDQLGILVRTLSFSTISSPHNGSLNAWLLPLPGWVDMRQSSRFLGNLEKGDHQIARHCKPLSLWTPLDLVILPQSSSIWSIARNEKYIVSMHPNMIRNRKILDRITRHILEAEVALAKAA
jgi:triacylglycerol lipase